MIFGRSRSNRKSNTKRGRARDAEREEIITDAVNSDSQRLQEEAGRIGGSFISAVDKVVHMQSKTIKAYVHWLRRQHPDASPAEIQKFMARHFLTTVSGTGGSAGMAAAIPGIGLFTGAAAIAGESVVFLDLAAVYTVASAYLRGIDIDDPERRRTIVLVALTGTRGSAVVDSFLGSSGGLPTKMALSRFSGPSLAEANNILTRTALRSVTKRLRRAWFGKFLPLGIGAIAGVLANRKLASAVTNNLSSSLGPLPEKFLTELPQLESAEEKIVKRSTSPREFLNFVTGPINLGGSTKSDSTKSNSAKASSAKTDSTGSEVATTSSSRGKFKRRNRN